MNVTTFLIAWILSVITMTLFSALIARITGKKMVEPVLISELIHRFYYRFGGTRRSLYIGWAIHFLVGIFFLLLYELLWLLTGFERVLLWGFVFGAIMGILGILGWIGIFIIHPRPPKLHFTLYYLQLFFAHIVFSITSLIIYHIFL